MTSFLVDFIRLVATVLWILPRNLGGNGEREWENFFILYSADCLASTQLDDVICGSSWGVDLQLKYMEIAT